MSPNWKGIQILDSPSSEISTKTCRYWSRTLFNATISSLIFCLEDLSIFDSGVLKPPTISVLLSTSSKVFFIYLGVPIVDAYMFTLFMSSLWILPFSIMNCPSVPLFMACFEVHFVWYKYCYSSFFFPVYLLGIFFFPTLQFQSVYFFLRWSLVGCICAGHVFLSIQLPYDFWLEHLIH